MLSPELRAKLERAATYEDGRFLSSEAAALSNAERQELDWHLVDIDHPLALQPGTIEMRFRAYAVELVTQHTARPAEPK